jgi:hypothetical protein
MLPNGLLIWAPAGRDHVSVHVNAGGKKAITALASITAANDKLLLFLIAKGKTLRVEQSQLGAPDDCILAHSSSIRTTIPTFHKYRARLRDNYQDHEPIRLIFDCHSLHRSAETRTFGASLGITLNHIPPGWTDELQPLDHSVFGPF